MSPKSLMKVTGPAPSGRSRMPSSFPLMSSNSLLVSVTFSPKVTYTTDTLPRVLETIFSTLAFSAIFSSIFRVTNCSIFSALAPGQGQMATATRTGVSGSLRLGISRTAKTPQKTTATRRTQETWRFSTKNRALFQPLESGLESCILRNDFYFFAVDEKRSAGGDDFLSFFQTFLDRYLVAQDVPRPDDAKRGDSGISLFFNNKDGIP